MLKVQNLHVQVEGKAILRGVDLVVRPGEVHAIMGPNGSGKSTLAMAMMGHPAYEVGNPKSETLNPKQIQNSKISSTSLRAGKIQKPEISLDGKSLVDKTPDQRARLGLFLAFQYPVAIDGVTPEQLLRKVVQELKIKNEIRSTSSGQELKISALEFRKYLEKEAEELGVKKELLRRSINDGFSGGEKKRLEILQLVVLKPRYAILDETDSGLDIDALRIIAKGIGQSAKSGTGIVLITHYQRILQFIKPDWVHVMVGGEIVESGGEELARRLEQKGYKEWLATGD